MLLYLSTYTRPDITFSINYLARFQSDSQTHHWTLKKRIFRYLRGTTNYGLLYSPSSTQTSTCYTDSDFAGDNKNLKSATGFIIHIFGCPVMWCSHLQTSIVQSSAEAEFMSL